MADSSNVPTDTHYDRTEYADGLTPGTYPTDPGEVVYTQADLLALVRGNESDVHRRILTEMSTRAHQVAAEAREGMTSWMERRGPASMYGSDSAVLRQDADSLIDHAGEEARQNFFREVFTMQPNGDLLEVLSHKSKIRAATPVESQEIDYLWQIFCMSRSNTTCKPPPERWLLPRITTSYQDNLLSVSMRSAGHLSEKDLDKWKVETMFSARLNDEEFLASMGAQAS